MSQVVHSFMHDLYVWLYSRAVQAEYNDYKSNQSNQCACEVCASEHVHVQLNITGNI